jgi:hypothetical protein
MATFPQLSAFPRWRLFQMPLLGINYLHPEITDNFTVFLMVDAVAQ